MALVFTEEASKAAIRLADENKIDRFWIDRAADLIRGVTWDGNGFSPVGNLSVSPDWPVKGTLRFTRAADNQRFKAYLTCNKWKVVKVK